MKLLLALLAFAIACPAAELAGTWKLAAPGRDGGEMRMTMVIRQQAAGYSGSITTEQGDVTLSDIRLRDDEVTFKIVTDDTTFQVTATLSGETIKGKYKVNDREGGTFSGSRAMASKPTTN